MSNPNASRMSLSAWSCVESVMVTGRVLGAGGGAPLRFSVSLLVLVSEATNALSAAAGDGVEGIVFEMSVHAVTSVTPKGPLGSAFCWSALGESGGVGDFGADEQGRRSRVI